VAVQPDGKIVCSGYSETAEFDFMLARYNADGTLDNTFATNGIFVLDFQDLDASWGIAIQTDGKVLACGLTTSNNNTNSDFIVVRLNTNGTVDPTFGTNGVAIADLGGYDRAWRMTVQPDGKILLAGTTFASGQNDLAIARLNTDGSLDTGFNTNGYTIISAGSLGSASDVAVLANGKIAFAGLANDLGVLGLLNTNGTLDTGFDGDGWLSYEHTSGFEAGFSSLLITPNQKILGIGSTGAFIGLADGFLAQFNLDGTLDPSFGSNGAVSYDNGFNFNTFSKGYWSSNGQIVISGDNELGSGDFGFAAWRLNADGSRDNSFSQNAIQLLDQGSGRENALWCAEAPNGDVILGGFYNPNNANVYQGFVARLDGSVATSIDEIALTSLETYPNPFTDRFQLDFDWTAASEPLIRVINAKGALVEADVRPTDLSSNRSYSIELPETAAKGIYMVHVSDGARAISIPVERL